MHLVTRGHVTNVRSLMLNEADKHAVRLPNYLGVKVRIIKLSLLVDRLFKPTF
jgi:hypothetical protein